MDGQRTYKQAAHFPVHGQGPPHVEQLTQHSQAWFEFNCVRTLLPNNVLTISTALKDCAKALTVIPGRLTVKMAGR